MADDTISRKMAIDTIADYERDSTAPIDYRAIIESLPTAEPQWIPVSDRLPKDGIECLVSVRYSKKFEVVGTATYSTNLFNVHKEDFFDSRGESGWYYFDGEYGFCKFRNVIAWMPLPKPYKGEQESEKWTT